jgi:hypothetical protein
VSRWDDHAWWFEPHFDIDRVARFLDIQPASVRRYLTEHGSFPEPAEQRSGRNYWTPAAVFRYAAGNAKPGVRGRILRLCPLDDSLGPARFLESQLVELRGVVYVLHSWEPADGRGRVGIAYPKDFQPFPLGNEEAPEHLLAMRPDLAAITVPKWPPGKFYDPSQPRIYVADRGGLDWYPWEVGWFDLVALLRVDLPWWSYGLTDTGAMNAWRPGAPAARIRPRVREFSAEPLDRCRPHDGSDTDQAIAIVADYLDHQLAAAFGISHGGHDEFQPRPGFHHAAVAAIPDTHPASPSASVIRQALHGHVDDKGQAVSALYTARSFDALLPVITPSILKVDRDQCSCLAHEWCHRLVLVDPADHNELGFIWVEHVIKEDDDKTPHQWWHDPLNLDVWAISATDGTTYATIGSRMPARGRAEEATIEKWMPFFRDSAGNPFPLPVTQSGLHVCGYDGSSPLHLAATLLALLPDAATDAYQLQPDVPAVRATGLFELISTFHETTSLSRDDLETLAKSRRSGPSAASTEPALFQPLA